MAKVVDNIFFLASSLWLITASTSDISGRRYVLIVHTQENDNTVRVAYKASSKYTGDQKVDNGILLHASLQGFKVKSLRNKDLVDMQVLKDRRSQFIKIQDTGFIQFHGRDYVVPRHLLVKAQQLANEADVEEFVDDITQYYAAMQSAENILKGAIHRLARQPESHLILQACEELGNEGITGASHPQMLPLYTFATRLPYATKIQAAQSPLPNDKRTYGQCAMPTADQCLGLCGYGCQCWIFVCGNCCFHQGCFEHDKCCRKKFHSISCLIPVGFNCNRFGGYPQCI